MSYEEFRRRIDTARNILVGAVPSPAGQIDQITYAMMYKFMNDIDDQSAALGGKRSYFIGDYEQYNWHKLMSSSLGAHERLELYRQAIQTMDKNPNIPELFRGIYQNAFLPFNSPNVLNLFLKEINKFNHGESDDIGDAYEYLLSITGAQGDVGQFRTPRHIIKFIVEAVNPTKDDTVIDPACGTAGFLIAAYNHVRSQHDGKDEQGNVNDEEKRLNASELDKIHHNYRGFDIDPTMVRTAKVNLYLHGFKTPDIINHDSLSSEDYWNDRYDVILANPPFMTPKGGIQPHKKFGISANRAEVLFVDYIASHLKPTGRAGIIVPEGVIFQSGKAYKELRKNLVENSLYAVVSLPSGVFNPYAGVKTSILLLDKELAKQNDEILFVKVENDGYSLGAQRRKVAGDQFPEALEVIERFKNGEELQTEFAHAVKRSEIAESGDYNLSGDRYKVVTQRSSKFDLVDMNEVADIVSGYGFPKDQQGILTEDIPFLKVSDMNLPGNEIRINSWNNTINSATLSKLKAKTFPLNTIIFPKIGAAIATNKKRLLAKSSTMDNNVMGLVPKSNIIPEFLFYIIKSINISNWASDSALPSINKSTVEKVKIPLPPIETQREIVAELDSYQRIIDAAQTIVKTYKPTIKINSEWQHSKLGDIFEMVNGRAFKTSEWSTAGLPIIRIANLNNVSAEYNYFDGKHNEKIEVNDGDFLFSWSGTKGTSFGPHLWNRGKGLLNQHIFRMVAKDVPIDTAFAYFYIKAIVPQIEAKAHGSGGLVHITKTELSLFEIPTPPIAEQKQIVAELEAEQKLIDANKKLIETFQSKIKSKIAEVWGE